MAEWYARGSGQDPDDLESIAVLEVLAREPRYDEARGPWRAFACAVARLALKGAVQREARRRDVLFDALSTSTTIALLASAAAGEWSAMASQEDAAYVDEVMRRLDASPRARRRLRAEVLYGPRPTRTRPESTGLRREVAQARRAAAVIVLRQ